MSIFHCFCLKYVEHKTHTHFSYLKYIYVFHTTYLTDCYLSLIKDRYVNQSTANSAASSAGGPAVTDRNDSNHAISSYKDRIRQIRQKALSTSSFSAQEHTNSSHGSSQLPAWLLEKDAFLMSEDIMAQHMDLLSEDERRSVPRQSLSRVDDSSVAPSELLDTTLYKHDPRFKPHPSRITPTEQYLAQAGIVKEQVDAQGDEDDKPRILWAGGSSMLKSPPTRRETAPSRGETRENETSFRGFRQFDNKEQAAVTVPKKYETKKSHDKKRPNPKPHLKPSHTTAHGSKAAKVASRAHRFVEQDPVHSEDFNSEDIDERRDHASGKHNVNDDDDGVNSGNGASEDGSGGNNQLPPSLPTMPRSPLVPPTRTLLHNTELQETWRVGLPRPPVQAPGWNRKLRSVDQVIQQGYEAGEGRSKSLTRPSTHISPTTSKLPSSQAAAALRGTRSEEKSHYQPIRKAGGRKSPTLKLPENSESDDYEDEDDTDDNSIEIVAQHRTSKSHVRSSSHHRPSSPENDQLDVYEDKVLSIFSNSRHMMAGIEDREDCVCVHVYVSQCVCLC